MIRDESFFEREQNAPMFVKEDMEYLKKNTTELLGRAQNWEDMLKETLEVRLVGESRDKVADSKLCKASKPKTPLADQLMRIALGESLHGEKQLRESQAAKSTSTQQRFERIIGADVERTFRSKESRAVLRATLQEITRELHEYAQGMSFVVSFLLLFLPPECVVRVIMALNDHVLPGYWRGEAVGYATDARLFGHIISHYPNWHGILAATREIPKATASGGSGASGVAGGAPDSGIAAAVLAHLRRAPLYTTPDMFCQKWFSGLCVHVLPVWLLVEYFEGLFSYGTVYLFGFGIALMETLGDELLATTEHTKVFELLRLDRQNTFFTERVLRDIMDGAQRHTETQLKRHLNIGRLDGLRKEVLVSSGLASALKAAAERMLRGGDHSSSEITFSSEDEEEQQENQCAGNVPKEENKDAVSAALAELLHSACSVSGNDS